MAGEEGNITDHKKAHRDRHSGRKADKKKAKKDISGLTDKQRNPKAFTFNSVVRAERRFRRTQDLTTKKQHIPVIDRTPLEPPPIVVAVVGPPKVGKTTLIQCLIKSFTKQPLSTIKGPVTIVSGKKRRVTLMECNNDINSMIDIAKVADLVLLLVDASFGFEMEIFEFLNICQVHGMPRVMGVLTHLDMLKHTKQLQRTKKTLKHRFWTEVYNGAKLFYLSGLLHGEYLRNEVKNLGRFISVIKFRPLVWRSSHPYILVDRMEDLTPPELIRQNPKVDRSVSLYGFVRGIPLNKKSSVHIPGCGDLRIQDVTFLPDPCPLPDRLKRRSLIEKERHIYAPFSGVGGIVYDKDAVYVELAGSHSHTERTGTGSELVSSLLEVQETLDAKMARSELQLFSGSAPITATDMGKLGRFKEQCISDEFGRKRRKVIFNEEDDVDSDDDDNNASGTESDASKDGLESESDDSDNVESEVQSRATKTPQRNGARGEERLVRDDCGKADVGNHKLQLNRLKRKNGGDQTREEVCVKKPKVVSVNKKLLNAIGADSDDNEVESVGDDGEEEENEEEIGHEDAQQLKSEERVRYHGLSAYKDSTVKNRVSDILMQLEGREQHPKGTKARSVSPRQEVEKRPGVPELDDSSDESMDDSSDKSSDESVEQSKMEASDSESSHDSDEEQEPSDREEGEGAEDSAVRWKESLAQRAADAFLERQANTQSLWKLVYGSMDTSQDSHLPANGAEKEEDVGGLFRFVNRQQQQHKETRDLQDSEDGSRFVISQLHDWTQADVRELIRDCFVTGKWSQSEDAAELLRLDDASDGDDELFGDFEDLETGEKHAANGAEPKDAATEDDVLSKKKIMEKKQKLKEKFDSEYDNHDGERTYYDELKQEVDQQGQLNKNEFEGLDDKVRVQLEGFRPGMYVRVEFASVPCELVTSFDPTYPLIVGGLQTGEENIGYLQVRVKKHRWHKKILKNRDPLIVSLGWRRFQTLPIYAKLEDNFRHRMLKYTPEHVACIAHFWGPITPQGTGFLAVQDVSTRQAGFRIAATGAVVELDKSAQVMKKLKLTGVPLKVYKKTAFIRGMFNSTLEVAKFEGAKLRTVSGVRGQIKKAANKPEGSFRATFEDKVLLSDIVFCRTWYRVEIPRLYNPVTTLLLPPDQKDAWRGMKTVGQLKREKGIRSEPAVDSLYTAIERQPKVFRPLEVPRQLQRRLPYKDKPKKAAGPGAMARMERQRVVVIREPHEQKVASMMKMLKTSFNHKEEQKKQAKQKKKEERRKELRKEAVKVLRRQKEVRKQVFRALSKMEQKKNNNTKSRR